MSRRFFVDSSVLSYAYGGTSSWQVPSRGLVAAAMRLQVELHVSAEAVQEFVYHRMRRGTRGPAVEAGRTIRNYAVVHDFDVIVLDRSLDLLASTPILGRDAVHAATALVAGFDHIVTTDPDFAVVPGLRVVSPEDALAG